MLKEANKRKGYSSRWLAFSAITYYHLRPIPETKKRIGLTLTHTHHQWINLNLAGVPLKRFLKYS